MEAARLSSAKSWFGVLLLDVTNSLVMGSVEVKPAKVKAVPGGMVPSVMLPRLVVPEKRLKVKS